MRLYVNGELIDTESSPSAQASEGPLMLGGNDDEEFFKGRIDEVRVYDRALDTGEIAADRATPIETPPNAPVAAYSFDAGEGEFAEDSAGNRQGALKNTEWIKLEIGCASVWGDELKGSIDEVRVYDRALDAGEIAADKATPIFE